MFEIVSATGPIYNTYLLKVDASTYAVETRCAGFDHPLSYYEFNNFYEACAKFLRLK